jgi:hypothetical protein
MVRRAKGLIGWVATGSARPDLTVLAVSQLLSGAIVLVVLSVFGRSG